MAGPLKTRSASLRDYFYSLRSITRQVRRGRASIGPAGSLHASYSAHMLAGEKRGFPGTIRLGGRMGCFASGYVARLRSREDEDSRVSSKIN